MNTHHFQTVILEIQIINEMLFVCLMYFFDIQFGAGCVGR